MRQMKWIGVAAALLLTASCFSPWVIIISKQLTISGIDAAGTNYGKPGYLHFVMTILFLVFTLTPKLWAKRINLAVTAINLAWATRNFLLLTTCAAGECPVKKAGLWGMLIASVLMLVSALTPGIKLKEEIKKD